MSSFDFLFAPMSGAALQMFAHPIPSTKVY